MRTSGAYLKSTHSWQAANWFSRHSQLPNGSGLAFPSGNLRISSKFTEKSKYRRRSPSLLFESVSCRATHGRFSMTNDLATDLSHERYVVEVDGIAKAEYPIFVSALKASLQLKQELPNCRVKLRDADEETAH
jgi:hypothetical protein